MKFFRQMILILFALILGGGQIFAASSSKERRDFAAAISAFQDGMWSRADMEFDQFRKDYPDSTNVPMAVLLEAQAEFKQGGFANTMALLTNAGNLAIAGNLADQYAYWSGEAQFTNGNYRAAADTFVSLAQNFPASPLRLRAVVEAASAYVRLLDWADTIQLLEQTNGVFQRAAQLDPGNQLVSRGRLLLAQAKFAQKDFAGEFAVLTSLNSQTLQPELDWQRAYLLCQNRNAVGDFEAALAAATNLLQIAPAGKYPVLHAESVMMLGTALEKLNRADEAMSAYQENLTNTAPEKQQRQAVLKIAELAIAQEQIPTATNVLGMYLTEFPDSPSADILMLTLGELHLKNYVAQPDVATNDLPDARARFDQFIGTFTNSPLLGKGYLDRGWCDWLAWEISGDVSDISNSLSYFKMAADKLPFSEDLAVARFKMGDALFALDDYAGARTNYESVVEDFTNFPAVGESLGAQALYQLSRVCIKLDDIAGAHDSLARIFEIYPTSTLVPKTILLVGEGMTDLNQPTNALALFQKFKEKWPDSDLLPEDELAMARAYEQERDWPSAIGVYDEWVKNFGTNTVLLPQVAYARAWANFQAGNETNAFQLFTNFIAKFPENPLAPVAQWWVGDHFFRAGDFADAEKNYKYVFQNWPTNSLNYPAKMMAGRAAMGWQGYQDAIDYFTSLTADTNCPPYWDAQALFGYGSALMQMPSSDTNKPLANIASAISYFKTIITKYPATEQAALALGEIGDCYLQLTNYDAATNAYTQVVNSTNASVAARSQAQIGIGLALEKMAAMTNGDDQRALLKLALDNYLAVWDSRLDANYDSFWVSKAGLQALPLVQMLGAGDANKFIDDMEGWFPQLKDLLEKKRPLKD